MSRAIIKGKGMKSPVLLRACQIWLLPLLLIIPGLYRLVLYGLPVTHDALTHLWRIARMHDSIQDYVLFPRWIPEMLLGFGYPTFNYYASSTYYLVIGLNLIGLHLNHAFIAIHCLLVWLAAVGMYLLARDIYKRQHPWAALVASVAYAYAPYLMVNIYVRSAIAELGAQALLPWIFWSFQRIWRAENPSRYVITAILSLGGLAFTHTISLLILPPLLIVYNLVLAISSSERKFRLPYSFAAMAGAMGVSCFFWGPLLIERGYVANTAFTVARIHMLPFNFLTMGELVDTHFFYPFTNSSPWQLGLIQTSGAILGILFLIWQHRTRATRDVATRNEWLFWIGASIICIVLMLEVTEPLWSNNDIMPIIQFPWRLLVILQLPIALLTSFPVAVLRPRVVQTVTALVLMLLLVVVHLPQLTWEYILDARTAQYNMAVNAYYDAIRGTIVEGQRDDLANQEFRPRWTDLSMRLDPTTVPEDLLSQQEADRQVRLLAANPYHLQLAIESASPMPLRMASYFFPGWAVILDGAEALTTYPSTNLGLLTADIPAGDHTVDIVWLGTSAQFWSGLISQITLGLLSLALLWRRTLRKWLWVMVPLLITGLVATYLQPPLAPVQTAELATSPPGLEFLGYTTPELGDQGVQISTYWLATTTSPASIKTHWQMVAENGEVVQEIVARPFYNGYPSQYWASNTVVDDGYWLPLPPGLAAGVYRIRMTLLDEQSDEQYDPIHATVYNTVEVGAVVVKSATDHVQPTHPLTVRFGESVVLTGYDIGIVEPRVQRHQALTMRPEIPVVYTGQTLAYTLYWQTEQITNDPYVGFVHLLDRWDIPHVQQDHSPGPLLQPSAVWTTYGTYPDSYQLPIPQSMSSGLYTPDVGMYDWRDTDRFDVTIPGVNGIFDHYELPQVKVINPDVHPTGTYIGAQFGEFAELVRFHVEGGQVEGGQAETNANIALQPGATLTLTTYYEAKEPSPTALTRFVQIRNAQNQILAQYDSEPQEGTNPTWAWVPGEFVADVIPLTLPMNSSDAQYTLYLGWYDADANFTHIPVFDRQGTRLANDEYPLLQLTITQ